MISTDLIPIREQLKRIEKKLDGKTTNRFLDIVDAVVREIVYGLVEKGWNKNNPDLIAGGCTYDNNSPNFTCAECLHAWQDETIFKKDYLHHESSDILNEIENMFSNQHEEGTIKGYLINGVSHILTIGIFGIILSSIYFYLMSRYPFN